MEARLNIEHAQTVLSNLAAARGERDTDKVTSFGASCVWTGISDSDREAWLSARHTILTASDMAAVLGESPYADAFDVYVSKTMPPPPDEKLGPYDPRFWGKLLELPIAHGLADFYGWEIRDGGHLLRSRMHPELGCTLDAEIVRSAFEGPIVYEGKLSQVPRDWSEEEGNLPTHILIQAQTQLLVTGAPRDLVSGLLQGRRYVQVDVEPFDDFHQVLVEQAEWFMDLVRRSDPPTPTARSKAALDRLFPRSDGSVVRLPIEAVEQTREIQELAAQMKAMEARSSELRNALRLAIGTATYGELPEPVGGKVAWKWGTQENGQRPLIAVTKIPGVGGPRKAQPVPAELSALPEGALIEKYRTTRRRSRR